MGTLILKVALKENPKVYRIIEVLGDTSLFKLAEVINDAYNFAFDHPFGFFDNISNPYRSEVRYELFRDLRDEGMDIESVDSGSVKKTKVKDVWKKIGDKMIFLFDYGDDWMFIVALKCFSEKEPKKKYPVILEKVGRSPRQY